MTLLQLLRRPPLLLPLALILALGVGGCVVWFKTHHKAPSYLTATAALADIEETVLASATIAPKQLVSVGAQASGRITALHYALGDAVVKGALIAEIDPATERNALDTAFATLTQEKAQRASAVAALKQAKLSFERAKITVAADATSHADFETAEANFHEAKFAVDSLDAQIRVAVIAVDTAKLTLGYTKVIAPLSGTVVAIVAPEGQTVNAVQSAPSIVKLADLDTMTVKAKISEADVPKVRVGAPVYFSILGVPDRRYTATLAAIEPAPESLAADQPAAASSTPQSSAVYYNGLFDIPNADHLLRPLMTAEVSIVLKSARQTLTVPSAALEDTTANGRGSVRTLDADGIAHRRPVRIGINNRVKVQILSGLSVGEKVIIGDAASLADDPNRRERSF
jgi:membrane fusion protein, macrolide-specific efflux system